MGGTEKTSAGGAAAAEFHRTACLSSDILSSVNHDVKRTVELLVVATRKYEQRLRAEEAEQTRRRILDALQERLRQAPAEPASVDQIARMARVSRSTVYLTFGSRAGLFCALGADIADRGGFDAVLDAAAHPDAIESLRSGIRAIVAMYAGQRDILRAIYSMAQLDAEAVGGSVQALDQGRAIGMASRARRLAEQEALRPDVTEAEAAHLLWLLTSFDAFDVLYTGRSLPAGQVAVALITTAERTLCRDTLPVACASPSGRPGEWFRRRGAFSRWFVAGRGGWRAGRRSPGARRTTAARRRPDAAWARPGRSRRGWGCPTGDGRRR